MKYSGHMQHLKNKQNIQVFNLNLCFHLCSLYMSSKELINFKMYTLCIVFTFDVCISMYFDVRVRFPHQLKFKLGSVLNWSILDYYLCLLK